MVDAGLPEAECMSMLTKPPKRKQKTIC